MRALIPSGDGSRSGRRTGAALVAFGVFLLVTSLLLGAALAPEVGSAEDGETRQTLVGSQGGGPGLHDHGSVYLLDGRETAWRAGDTDSYFDVTMLDNGSVMAGFMDDGYEDCGPYESPCTHTGFRIIDPNADSAAAPEIEHEYSFPVRSRANSEVHDVELLDSGEFLVSDMEHERIFTVKNGEITWQWNASSRYDAPDDPTRTDWLHINDVDVIGEDRYLVSVRNAHQLVIVERGEGVVEVINGDEATTEGDPTLLRQQHNPQWLGDGNVLVADSHNDRIVELERAEDGDWEVAWEIYAAEGVNFNWPRDADRLPNGNTLITDSLNQRVVEVDRNGSTVWSYGTPQVPYEAERLPAGETVGGVSYADGSDEPTSIGDGQSVPVLSFLLVLFQTGLQTPFWFTEVHVAVTIVSLLSVLGGGGLVVRDRLRRR
ncbi:arylsulfotransferase family protein [Halobellus rarus]|uniref:Arylsulfotransferase family protein n=1 Tax=Halobellus rarus TaxID=1126237 RepID=A0ABD6CL00_9EURY|nr:arylsulfotransferase family protein [Halobellus rarus]